MCILLEVFLLGRWTLQSVRCSALVPGAISKDVSLSKLRSFCDIVMAFNCGRKRLTFLEVL